MHEVDCYDSKVNEHDVSILAYDMRIIKLGHWADTVIELMGNPPKTSYIANEAGLVVQWVYPGVTFTMGRAINSLVSVYAVQKIEVDDEG